MLKEVKFNNKYNDFSNSISFYNDILPKTTTFEKIFKIFSWDLLFDFISKIIDNFSTNIFLKVIIPINISNDDFVYLKQFKSINDNIFNTIMLHFDKQFSLIEKKYLNFIFDSIINNQLKIKIAYKNQMNSLNEFEVFYDKNSNILTKTNYIYVNKLNYNFYVYSNWLESEIFDENIIQKNISYFNNLWNNSLNDVIVMDIDERIIDKISLYNTNIFSSKNDNNIFIDNKKNFNFSNKPTLDYNGKFLYFYLDNNISENFKNSFDFFRVKPFVEKIENNVFYFKNTMSFQEIKKLEINISKILLSIDGTLELSLTKEYLRWINERDLNILERSRISFSIKNKNYLILDKFNFYKDIVNSSMIRELRNQQMWDSFFMYSMKKCGNFSVPGSGKTSSSLGVFSFLRYKKEVDRILVIGPKNCFKSWEDEFNFCFEGKIKLNLFNIHDEKSGKNKFDKRNNLKFNYGDYNLILINYQSLNSYVDILKDIVSDKTLLIFDEIHKIKRFEGKWFKDALCISSCGNYIIGMTGTPIPNTYLDIYNFLNILYKFEYKDFFNFDISKLKNPSKEEIEEINFKLNPFFCRTTKKELGVPEPNDDIIYKCEATKEENELFWILMSKYQNNVFSLYVRLLQMESDPKMLYSKISKDDLKNILYDINVEETEIEFIDCSDKMSSLINSIKRTSKKEKCINLIKNIVQGNSKKVILWCIFKNSILSFKNELSSLGINVGVVYGDTSLYERTLIINDFKNGNIDVLISNPHTLAESISLHTVCHDAIYFEYSFDLVHLLQSKDRIHRLGLKENQYTQWHFMITEFKYGNGFYSFGDKIYNRLKEKEKIMLDAIDKNIIEYPQSTKDDLNIIFKDFFKTN